MGIICFILRDIKLISMQTLYYFSEQQNCVPVNLIRNIVSSSDIWESFAGKAKCLFKPFSLNERDSNLWLLKSYTIFTLKYLWPSSLYLFHILPVSFKQTKYNRFWLEWFLYLQCNPMIEHWSRYLTLNGCQIWSILFFYWHTKHHHHHQQFSSSFGLPTTNRHLCFTKKSVKKKWRITLSVVTKTTKSDIIIWR